MSNLCNEDAFAVGIIPDAITNNRNCIVSAMSDYNKLLMDYSDCTKDVVPWYSEIMSVANKCMLSKTVDFNNLTDAIVRSTFQGLCDTYNGRQFGKDENAIKMILSYKVDLRKLDSIHFRTIAVLNVSTDNNQTHYHISREGDLISVFNEEVARLMREAAVDMLYENNVEPNKLKFQYLPIKTKLYESISEGLFKKEDIKTFLNTGAAEGSVKEYMNNLLSEYQNKNIDKPIERD